ncbi:MAG: hypothetical protein RMN52_07385 [Anaerolineae bacterium]|nr:hypothetical protein [Candidatus Roseilinea sp.]MDW8449809.1 hypothetical protein [Anaerolineae bacterium]
MQHRHLNHSDYTLAAIDDVIEHGNLRDWVELARAVLRDDTGRLREKVQRICRARMADNPQAYRVWQLLAERCEATP